MYIHVHLTHLCNWSAPSCYSSTAIFNNCKSELTPYTVLGYSYQVSFHDVYQCQGHAHYDTDYSCHITALEFVQPTIWGSYHATIVINTLGGRYTHKRINTHTYTDIHTETILGNQACAGCRPLRIWFKNSYKLFLSYIV